MIMTQLTWLSCALSMAVGCSSLTPHKGVVMPLPNGPKAFQYGVPIRNTYASNMLDTSSSRRVANDVLPHALLIPSFLGRLTRGSIKSNRGGTGQMADVKRSITTAIFPCPEDRGPDHPSAIFSVNLRMRSQMKSNKYAVY